MPSLTAVLALAAAADRERIREELEVRDFTVVADAVDAASAVAAAARDRPDVCLVDTDLPGGGLAVVARIAARAPTTTIIVRTPTARPSEMIAALEAGASGYATTKLAGDGLARSLRAAHAGEPVLARSLVPHLIEHVRRGPRRLLALPDRTVVLTPREWEVAELVQVGLSTDEVAQRLGLSPVTVRRHISALVRKSGSSSRDALVDLLRQHAR
jgi:DNA-binding NarL/FixJ family response regulator